jgi:hypothetical protein
MRPAERRFTLEQSREAQTDTMTEFSVVICTYNRASPVTSAVRNVLDRTFGDLEETARW